LTVNPRIPTPTPGKILATADSAAIITLSARKIGHANRGNRGGRGVGGWGSAAGIFLCRIIPDQVAQQTCQGWGKTAMGH
jgi:hypothetical protein